MQLKAADQVVGVAQVAGNLQLEHGRSVCVCGGGL